ncbi:MAG: hypothetical protein RR397_03810 [Odoribacter sp.]
MVKISFTIILLCWVCGGLFGQMTIVSDSITLSGVVIHTEDLQTLPNVTCRYGHQKAMLSDENGRFVLNTFRGDTVRFTYVGLKPFVMIIPDSLIDKEYMVGIFMSPDTLMLSEVLIISRLGQDKKQNTINARNNMSGILQQALSPVREMDADMNQRRMIHEYARRVEMKGHVEVGAGIGTQSLEAYKLLRIQKKMKDEKARLNEEEIDLLKKLYYVEKREKQYK